jgi:membrane protein implicated in regulation of membrane protease activity
MIPMVNWLLIVVGAILILIEVILGAISGFDFLLIGSAILVGGVIGLISHSSLVGLAMGGVLSISYVLLGRNKLRAKLRRPGIPSNVDAIIGHTALVTELITLRRPGRIKLDAEEWRALPDLETATALPPSGAEISFPVGATVRVTRIDGVTTYVVAAELNHPLGGAHS